MELRHLRYFVAVARHLNFTAAARSVHVTQAAISETVMDLESEIGAKLLARTRQSVQLTAAGKSFLRNAENILASVDEAALSAAREGRGEAGHVSIGFLGATSAPFLPKLLREFQRAAPGIGYSVLDATPRELTNALADGRIDVGFTRPEEEGAQRIPVEQFELYADELCAAVPLDHPLARGRGPLEFKALAREPLVMAARSSAPWYFDTIIASCRRAGFAPRISLVVTFPRTILVLAQAGIGIGIVTMSASYYEANRDVVFRRLTPKSDPIPTLLVWPKGLQSPSALAFIDFTVRRAPAMYRNLRLQRNLR